MKKLFATVPATIVAALLSFGQPALAAGPFDVSGSLGAGTTTITSQRQVDNTTFLDETVAGPIGGSVTGTYTITETVIVYPSHEFTVIGRMTCACTVRGASGTLTLLLEANGEPDGSFRGHFAVIGGTGGLADLHGQGTFQGGQNVASGYAGDLFFAP